MIISKGIYFKDYFMIGFQSKRRKFTFCLFHAESASAFFFWMLGWILCWDSCWWKSTLRLRNWSGILSSCNLLRGCWYVTQCMGQSRLGSGNWLLTGVAGTTSESSWSSTSHTSSSGHHSSHIHSSSTASSNSSHHHVHHSLHWIIVARLTAHARFVYSFWLHSY